MPLFNPASSASSGWSLVNSWTFSTNVTEVDFANLGGYSELLIFTNGITKGTTGETAVRFSVDNGSSFLAGASDYETVAATGVVGVASSFGLHNTNATAARSAAIQVLGSNVNGIYKPVMRVTRPGDGLSCRFVGSTSPINAVRIFPSAGGNITGGNIQVFGRA